MKLIKHIYLLCFIVIKLSLILACPSKAQTDSTHKILKLLLIKNISVLSRADSLPAKNINSQTAISALSFNPSLSYRLFSPVGLATISFRGGSANGTTILWEGLPLNSASNGQFDVNLLTNFQGSLNINTNSNIGNTLNGAINLKTDTKDKYNSIAFTMGSFGLYQTHLKNHIALAKKWHFDTYLSHFRIENNYELINNAQRNFGKQHHNAANITQVTLQAQKEFASNAVFKAQYWFSNAFREIAPGVLSDQNRDWQQDISHRLLLQYNTAKAFKMSVLLADERLNFFLSQQFTTLPTQSNYARAKLNVELVNSKKLLLGLEQYTSIDRVYNESIGTKTDVLQQLAQRSFYTLTKKLTLKSKLGVISNTKINKVEGNFGFDFNLLSNSVLGLNIERKYRLPTLNERFWQPGGNPNIIPEEIDKFEMNYQYKANTVYFQFQAYQYLTKNYIQWQPSLSSFWQPTQLTKVLSRGVESLQEFVLWKDKLKLNTHLSYNEAFSLNTQNLNLLNSFVESRGVQLIFLPQWNAGAKVQASVGKYLNISIESQYYSSRNLDFSGTNQGVPINLANGAIEFNYPIKEGKKRLLTVLQINNLTNLRYEWQPNFPMPGINGSLTLKYLYR